MIYIDDRQNKIATSLELFKTLEEVVQRTLKEESVLVPYEVSILMVDNEAIREINLENRGIDKETDVLSFPMLDYPKGKVFKDVYKNHSFAAEDLNGDELVLGDIVLSLEKAKEQCDDYNHSFLRESCYLTVHSVLHLLGYDHMEEEEKTIMREREESILENFNLTRS